MDGFSYLYQVGLKGGRTGYHILPDSEVSQDVNMKPFRRANRLKVENIPQPDGSRFKVITTESLSVRDLMEKIRVQSPGIRKLLMETVLPVDDLREIISGKFLELGIVCYVTHMFFGGNRIIPIITHHSAQTFYDGSGLYSKFVAEDGMGIILESDDVGMVGADLGIEKFGVVEYFPQKRLCPSCGRVFDSDKPISHPNWGRGR